MVTDTLERPAVAARNYIPASQDMGDDKWLDVDGIRTRYFDQGSGERIVMIHGAQVGASDGASSAKTWSLNFPVLKAWHNVIAFDKLGQGYTDNPKTDADYTMHACSISWARSLTTWSAIRAAAMWSPASRSSGRTW
jgi:pimeloyl-ACP methyl ester carboxylesterase